MPQHSPPFDLIDYFQLGRTLMSGCQQVSAFEEGSQYIVRRLYESMTVEGQHALVLARLYRLVRVEDLPRDLEKLVDESEKYVMALMGTYGKEAAWCNRHSSVAHQVIPINSIMVPERIPMFEQLLIKDMDVDLRHLYNTQDVMTSIRRPVGGAFHVEHVPGSSIIPAQVDFVKPYGVESLVGFGGLVPDQRQRTSLFMLIAFSSIHIDQQAANRFCSIQPYVTTALDFASEKRLFA
jgi:hypothetical protein